MLIDYKNDLNPAQYEAATTLEGAVLVIAGAGSGKTRTIVYRLARLIESGVPASSILLLTFTRKAAHEMLERAKRLMQQQGMPSLSEHPNHQPAAAHTAEDVAAQLNTSVRTLHRQLKEEGVSLQRLKNAARREHAIRLLLQTGKPVKQIATAVGFDSEKSFARAFREWTGVAPSAYRTAGSPETQHGAPVH